MIRSPIRLVGKIAALGPSGWRDCARAVFELALANRRLDATAARELLATPPASRSAGQSRAPSQAQADVIARVAFIVPRVGASLPWRSDCLVQALAARRWLAGHGIGSDICIGVRKPEDDEFGAHAWLKVGDQVVTGGDISSYAALIEPERGDKPRIGVADPPPV